MNGQQAAEPLNATCFSTTHQPAQERRFKGGRNRAGGESMAVNCPHCRERATVRTTKQITLLVKEIRFVCIECNHGFVATLSIDRTTTPSERPDPRVKLRYSPHVNHTPANDDNQIGSKPGA